MSAYARPRLVSTIAREVADILEFEVKDPSLCHALPTVIGVKLSPDGEEAVVAVAVEGASAEREKARAALAHDRAFIRARLARRLSVRRVPNLTFVLTDQLHSPSVWEEGDDG